MNPDLTQIFLSPIDEDHFGIRTARAVDVTLVSLNAVVKFCLAEGVRLLIARCSVSELGTAQAMEKLGFLLMDTLIHYERDLITEPIPKDICTIPVRSLGDGDEDAVRNVAAEAFRGYFGHYHADERLDRKKCDEAYISWAFNSCVSSEAADEVLVAEVEGSVAGFATLRMKNREEGEGVLFGIAPSAQRLGIYRSFILRGMKWCLSKGAVRMSVSTQLNNLAVQKVWARLGFVPCRAYYTFHKWFAEP
ncbi:MAG: GNAT family N-acetyltransferase [Deltaproteobacteria bacterium]|nr:GNAT family N-acetyltransferase [Deltaproteobacteria bacterium]